MSNNNNLSCSYSGFGSKNLVSKNINAKKNVPESKIQMVNSNIYPLRNEKNKPVELTYNKCDIGSENHHLMPDSGFIFYCVIQPNLSIGSQIETIWSNIKSVFSGNDDIEFVTIMLGDLNYNHISSVFNITQMPTFLLSTPKKIIKYDGLKKISNICDFLKRNLEMYKEESIKSDPIKNETGCELGDSNKNIDVKCTQADAADKESDLDCADIDEKSFTKINSDIKMPHTTVDKMNIEKIDIKNDDNNISVPDNINTMANIEKTVEISAETSKITSQPDVTENITERDVIAETRKEIGEMSIKNISTTFGVIGKLKSGEKVKIVGKCLAVEDAYFQSWSRTFSGQSREKISDFLEYLHYETKRILYRLLKEIRDDHFLSTGNDNNNTVNEKISDLTKLYREFNVFLNNFDTISSAYAHDSITSNGMNTIKNNFETLESSFLRELVLGYKTVVKTV